MRKCYKCNATKEFTEFPKDRTQCGGYSYDCKACRSVRCKLQREKDPEKYRQQNRRSVEKNYKSIRESQKKHLIRNRDKILKRRKELREPRKVEINALESIRRKTKRKNDPVYLQKERHKRREYYSKNKDSIKPKHDAHLLVMYAVRLGMIKKEKECQICRSTLRVEGHHEDYKKPLDVIWLCKVCHVNVHKGNLKIDKDKIIRLHFVTD